MTSIRLQDIERNSWRTAHKGGLMDILFGFMLLGACISALVGLWGAPAWLRIFSLSTIQFGGVGFMVWMRRREVYPRVGSVKFAARRARRTRSMRIMLACCVAITALLAVFTALSRRLGFAFLGDTGALPAWVAISAVIMVPIGALAIFLDCPRLLLHGSLFVVAEFCLLVIGLENVTPYAAPILFGVGSLVSFGIGISISARFLRSVPRVAADALWSPDA